MEGCINGHNQPCIQQIPAADFIHQSIMFHISIIIFFVSIFRCHIILHFHELYYQHLLSIHILQYVLNVLNQHTCNKKRINLHNYDQNDAFDSILHKKANLTINLKILVIFEIVSTFNNRVSSLTIINILHC